MKRVALLGPGTYTEESALHYLGRDDFEFVNYNLIPDVFNSTVEGNTDYSVIPIENTFEGSVSLHVDTLVHEVDLPIQAEWIYPISINLLRLPGADGGKGAQGEELAAQCSQIRKVYSHGVTLAQCQKFLRQYLPHVELEPVGSNGEGARLVREAGDSSAAALAPLGAGALYQLETLAAGVQDHHGNFTRFVLIGGDKPQLREGDLIKTTILVTLPEDFPGALHQVLSAFAWRKINLTKIESRPTKKKLGSYFFYIDIKASINSVLLPAALQEIEAIGCQVRMLGSYPVYDYKNQPAEV